jgi:hypothetical protein
VKVLKISVAVLLLAGSSPSRGGELSAPELKDARALYVGKCAKCHKLHAPDQYSPEKWDLWMGKMARKAKLTPEQTALLARYISAGRSGQVQLPKN